MSGGTRISNIRPEKPGSPDPVRGRKEASADGKAKEAGVRAEAQKAPAEFLKEAGGALSAGNAVFPKTASAKRGAAASPLADASPQNSLPQGIGGNSGGVPSGNPGAVFAPAGQTFARAAAGLGLPRDFLSVTLLAFCRFFSLAPDPAFLGRLRRELLSSHKSSSPQGRKEKAALEASALGAVAALDKGIALSPEARERYARCLNPPFWEAEEGADVPVRAGDARKDGNGDPRDREEAPGPEELRAISEEEAKKDGLLDFLNSLPGKDGQRWAVFPFKIKVRGIQLTVFVRLLKKKAGGDGYAIVDIAGPKRSWRCFLRKNGGGVRADMQVYPELPPKALDSLRKGAARFFGSAGPRPGLFEEVLARNGGESPSWAEDLCAQPLPSVDEKV